MQVLLTQDVSGLGYKNEIVDVRPGYGRNYLIPKGYALMASKSIKKQVAENLRQAAHKAYRIKTEAENLVSQIGDITLQIGAKSSENGKIFGSVTALQVATALRDKGFSVDRDKIIFTDKPKQLGTYTVTLDLHKEIKHTISIEVVAE